MNILYLSYINEDLRSGYKQKIYGQVRGLGNSNEVKNIFLGIISNEGYKVYSFKKDDKQLIYLGKCERIVSKEKNFFDDLILFYNYIKFIKKFIKEKDIKAIYIRRIVPITPILLSFLSFLNKENIKIFYEYPTFPWEKEMKEQGKKILYFLDKIQYKALLKKVNCLVIVGKNFLNLKNLYKGKIIEIENAIDMQNIKIIKKQNKDKNIINFIGVAGLALWHGYDRFILSMAEYYKNNPKEIINFHIVGDGDKKLVNELKKIVKNNNLEKYVIFYGYKSGKDLDEVYNKSDIGIGSLGNFRKGILSGGALKNQEYCAKGLPFIIAGYDDNYKDVDFMYKVSADESLINLSEIIDWYKNLQVTSEQIRKYVEDNLTWDIQMKKVVDYILETEEK